MDNNQTGLDRSMTWRDNAWEFLVVAASWIAMLGALVFVAVYFIVEAIHKRRSWR
jgi:hypothetical protein